MKKYIAALVSAVCICGIVSAQPASYNANTIPEKLLKDADVVKRYENISFEVTDIDRAKENIHQVYTVLNKDAASHLMFAVGTSRYRKLTDVEIKVYDAAGLPVSRIKQKDLSSIANTDGLIHDGVYQYYDITPLSYPVTVEYKYQLTYTGTLFYPDYSILGNKEGVEFSSFTVKVPTDLGLHYKEQEIKLKPTVSTEGIYSIYKWSVKEMTAIKYEPGSVSSSAYYPAIKLSPKKFRFYNTSGELSSWKKFGEWASGLTAGLEELPAERRQFFAEMVKNEKSEPEKIARIYDYLQQNFRYVSIQLGIGGYKPFPAKFTDEKKYGDCKALSFYMYSVLKSLGIRSHLALINAQYNGLPVDPEFPESGFNHMILCVPQAKDSIWLECTSKTNDFNYLGTFTENRNALLLTENGGVLVATPRSRPAANKVSVFTTVELNEDGSGKTNSIFSSMGDFREMMSSVSTGKKEDQKEFIVNTWGFKHPDAFTVTKADDRQKTIINLDIQKVPEFKAGSKMFVNPRLYRIWKTILPVAEARTHDYYFSSVFEQYDTTVYKLPAGYSVDVLPREKTLENEFVSFKTKYWYDDNKNEVVTASMLSVKQNRVPSASFALVKKSMDEVLSDDKQKIVIAKK